MSNSENLRIDYFSDLNKENKVQLYEEINSVINNADSLVTIAHNIELLKILSSSFDYKMDILLIRKKGLLEGFMPISIIRNKVVSIPHFSYGGYLGLKELKSSQTKLILRSLNRKYGKNYFIRDFIQLSKYYSENKVACFLKLEDDSESQFSRFSSKLRSQIRKAKKNGLTVSTSVLEDFFPVYVNNMHRLGSPHLPKFFFNEIITKYRNGEIEVFAVKKNEMVIGASIVVSFNNFIEVCWAGTYKEYNYLAPNMLLYWSMIKYSINNNIKTFSFGRSTKNSGPLRFKKQWGSEEVQLVWNYSKSKRFKIENFKVLSFIWRNLPRSVIEILGPLITKYIY